jgi:hypothetical protein
VYDSREFPPQTGGNVYYCGARPYARESGAIERTAGNPSLRIAADVYRDRVNLLLNLGEAAPKPNTTLVTTALLGKTRVAGLPYEDRDGAPLKVDTDYFGTFRDASAPTPGPFEKPGTGQVRLQVWPVEPRSERD